MSDHIHFIKRMQLSLYHMGFYHKVLREKTGKAVRYGVLMALFMGSLTMIAPMVQWSDTVDQVLVDIRTSAPSFEIRDGRMIKLAEPYAIDNGSLALVLDSAKSVPVRKNATMGLYFQQESLKLSGAMKVPVEQPYRSLFVKPFGKSELIQFVTQMKAIGWLMIPLGGIIAALSVLGSSVLAALCGMGIYRANKKKLSFRDSYVISLYAHTVPWLVGVITSAFLVAIPYFMVMALMLVALTYVRACHWKGEEL